MSLPKRQWLGKGEGKRKITLRPALSEEFLTGCVLFGGLTPSVSCQRHCLVVSGHDTDALGGTSQGAPCLAVVYYFMPDTSHSVCLHGGRTPVGGRDCGLREMVTGEGSLLFKGRTSPYSHWKVGLLVIFLSGGWVKKRPLAGVWPWAGLQDDTCVPLLQGSAAHLPKLH